MTHPGLAPLSSVRRFVSLVTLGFLAIGLGACADGTPTVARAKQAATSGTLAIHQINVGQGHATLLIGPDGTRVLVDAGRSGSTATGKLMPYLAAAGLPAGSAFDYAVLTHRDADHYGGFTELVSAGYDVTRGFYDNGSTRTSTTIEQFLAAAASTTAGPVRPLPLGTVLELGGGATATCVAVGGSVLGHGAVAVSDENDLSIALLVRHGDFDMLIAGDLGGGDDDAACTGRSTAQANVETPLALALTGGATPALGVHGVEVLLVNHHGSASSTNADFMNLLNPRVALIGVGANAYEHPRSVVVDNVLGGAVGCVTATPSLVLQTDEGQVSGTATSFTGFVVGDVAITTDGLTSYSVSATGAVYNGADERVAAGLPTTFALDEGPAPGCTGDAACDDGNPCTVDTCVAGACQHVPGNAGALCRAAAGPCDAAEVCDGATAACPADQPAANGTSCSDGNACNGLETCQSGACVAGTALTCSDGNACTADACDPLLGCRFTPVAAGTPCSGGACDGAGTCAPSVRVRVADLDATRTSTRTGWTATVTITVVDTKGAVVSGAVVTGAWSDGFSGTGSCTTSSQGRCSLTSGAAGKKATRIVFTVSNVAAASPYDPTANGDPDGDSNGTRIVIPKP